jgi:hypothetical protein
MDEFSVDFIRVSLPNSAKIFPSEVPNVRLFVVTRSDTDFRFYLLDINGNKTEIASNLAVQSHHFTVAISPKGEVALYQGRNIFFYHIDVPNLRLVHNNDVEPVLKDVLVKQNPTLSRTEFVYYDGITLVIRTEKSSTHHLVHYNRITRTIDSFASMSMINQYDPCITATTLKTFQIFDDGVPIFRWNQRKLGDFYGFEFVSKDEILIDGERSGGLLNYRTGVLTEKDYMEASITDTIKIALKEGEISISNGTKTVSYVRDDFLSFGYSTFYVLRNSLGEQNGFVFQDRNGDIGIYNIFEVEQELREIADAIDAIASLDVPDVVQQTLEIAFLHLQNRVLEDKNRHRRGELL